jgi:hypothetical protein
VLAAPLRFAANTKRLILIVVRGNKMRVRDNRKFTLAWNAMCSFMSARSVVDMIHAQQLGEQDPRTVVLFGAIAGYYAAPFMSTNKLGRLPKSIIPSQYEAQHESLMDLRNKVFLHLDKDVNFDGRSKVTNLRVTIDQDSDGVKIEAKSWTPTPASLAEITALIDLLIKELHESVMEYLCARLPRACVAPGAYRLKTEGANFELEPDT